tara:strand:- start:1724 stop:2122 length:399 start_codon:yes stop_codon:yes gene_type:complete
MAFISPALPFERDIEDGYVMNTTLSQVFKQNLKNLILTAPGERMMDPTFGVGLRNYLFSQNSYAVEENLRSRINQQVNKYMPFIKLSAVNIGFDDTTQLLAISIEYHIPGINIKDRFEVTNSTVRNTGFQTI